MTESFDLLTNVEPSSLSDLGDILADRLFDQPRETDGTKVRVQCLALALDLQHLVSSLAPGVYPEKTKKGSFR